MHSHWIAALRSAALNVPDLARAEAFYTATWRLTVAARAPGVLWLRGGGADHHLLALHAHDGPPALRCVTLRACNAAALDAVARATVAAGGSIVSPPSALPPLHEPAGGTGVLLRDPQGRRFQVVHGDTATAGAAGERASSTDRDRPLRLAHVVLNSHDVPAAQRFLETALGFTLADRTRAMAFMNCNRDHHSLALADADNDALNHIAFLMPDIDAVMRGGGRMKDADHPIEWGPGRHGPGDNAFNYFIDPFGVVVEYTAEVEQIDAGHVARQPADWAWPPGRVDQWGISPLPSARLKQAQRSVFFAEGSE